MYTHMYVCMYVCIYIYIYMYVCDKHLCAQMCFRLSHPLTKSHTCHNLPPSEIDGGCFGLFLQAQKGDTYFTELAERAEYGNCENYANYRLRAGALQPSFTQRQMFVVFIVLMFLCVMCLYCFFSLLIYYVHAETNIRTSVTCMRS